MTSPTGSEQTNPGQILQPNPDQVNEFHRYADTDNAPDSGHHTLGIDPNQASPGDHNHDGRNSALISGGLTEADADARYVNVTGDTLTGDLNYGKSLWTNTGSRVHIGGGGAELSLANRSNNSGDFVESPGDTGNRWVWYAASAAARLWSGADKFEISVSQFISRVKIAIVKDTGGATDWPSATLEIRDVDLPRITFHQPGQVASQIGQAANSETIRTFNNPGTGYADFRAGGVYDFDQRVYSANNPPPSGIRVATGSYTGNGAATRDFALPATPVLVIVTKQFVSGSSAHYSFSDIPGQAAPLHGGFVNETGAAGTQNVPSNAPQRLTNGFRVNNAGFNLNQSSIPYAYLAFY